MSATPQSNIPFENLNIWYMLLVIWTLNSLAILYCLKQRVVQNMLWLLICGSIILLRENKAPLYNLKLRVVHNRLGL
jgi:hypothetical protein